MTKSSNKNSKKGRVQKILVSTELAKVFPASANVKGQLPALTKDILEHGIRNSLVVWKETGYILDGVKRWGIAKRHGVPFKTILISLSDMKAAKELRLKMQLERRNLSKFERAVAIIAVVEKGLEKQAKENQKLSRGSGVRGRKQSRKTFKPIDVNHVLAQLAGVSRDFLQHVRYLLKHKDLEVMQELKDGKISVHRAYNWKRRKQKKKDEKMSKKKNSGKNHKGPSKKGPKKYRLIYIDPPWRYSRFYNGRTKVKIPYPTMGDQEILRLPIGELADKDCSLFMWATCPKLATAMKAIEAWGFRYITVVFVWVKQYPVSGTLVTGLGYWSCPNVELVLLGTKGHPNPNRGQSKQIILAPRGRHSAKPPETRARILQLTGNVPRIELFARERVPGWTVMGNEIDGKDIRNALRDHGVIFPEDQDLKKAA